MSFATDTGYVPTTIDTIMLSIMDNYNTQFGTTFTAETFIGTNAYKYFYALAQRIQEGEIKTSEIFVYLQQYFRLTNERISRPVVTNPGLIEAFSTAGYVASVKPMIDADAGKINICVDVVDNHAKGLITITSYANLVSGTDDSVTVGATVFTAQVGAATPGATTFQAATSNTATATSLAAQINAHATAGALVYATSLLGVVTIRAIAEDTGGNAIVLGYTDNDTNVGATKSATTLLGGLTADDDYDDVRLAICTLIKNSTVAGAVTQGTELETIVLTNGQAFDFKFYLPNRISILLKLTITVSENNQVLISSPEDTKQVLIDNIVARYSLGRNFEPQRYFSVVDAPWASDVLLQWSDDNGANYYSTVYNADFDDIFTILLENITLVEA